MLLNAGLEKTYARRMYDLIFRPLSCLSATITDVRSCTFFGAGKQDGCNACKEIIHGRV